MIPSSDSITSTSSTFAPSYHFILSYQGGLLDRVRRRYPASKYKWRPGVDTFQDAPGEFDDDRKAVKPAAHKCLICPNRMHEQALMDWFPVQSGKTKGTNSFYVFQIKDLRNQMIGLEANNDQAAAATVWSKIQKLIDKYYRYPDMEVTETGSKAKAITQKP